MPATDRAKSVLSLIIQAEGVYIQPTTLNGVDVEVIARRFEMPDGGVDVFPLAVVVDDAVMGMLALPGEGWSYVQPEGEA